MKAEQPNFAPVEDILYNPVFNALLSGDRHLGFGTDSVKCFDEEVSPFVGFATDNSTGFQELYDLLPPDRRILYATPTEIKEPAGWEFRAQISGLQFVFLEGAMPTTPAIIPAPLNESHVQEMIQLTALTKPGPFDKRTIEFGHYHGIFENGRLAAMTGQRMHVYQHTEISAVCTHPDFLGKGYAAALILHQLHQILSQNQQPFLHVRDDNDRAIALYERLGFKANRPMNFYFMKKRT